MKASTVAKIGKIAAVLSVLMYVSYISQIMNNLHGMKGSFVQPAVAAVNCIVWTIYGFYSKPKNKPIIIANIPGIILGIITAITSF